MVGVGLPDINFCASGVESWIEMKCPTEPMRSGTALFGSGHQLSVDQKNWIKRQVTAGGRAFVVIRTDKRWLLIHGRHADRLNEYTVNELIDVALWHARTPIERRTEWNALRLALIRG